MMTGRCGDMIWSSGFVVARRVGADVADVVSMSRVSVSQPASGVPRSDSDRSVCAEWDVQRFHMLLVSVGLTPSAV